MYIEVLLYFLPDIYRNQYYNTKSIGHSYKLLRQLTYYTLEEIFTSIY